MELTAIPSPAWIEYAYLYKDCQLHIQNWTKRGYQTDCLALRIFVFTETDKGTKEWRCDDRFPPLIIGKCHLLASLRDPVIIFWIRGYSGREDKGDLGKEITKENLDLPERF